MDPLIYPPSPPHTQQNAHKNRCGSYRRPFGSSRRPAPSTVAAAAAAPVAVAVAGSSRGRRGRLVVVGLVWGLFCLWWRLWWLWLITVHLTPQNTPNPHHPHNRRTRPRRRAGRAAAAPGRRLLPRGESGAGGGGHSEPLADGLHGLPPPLGGAADWEEGVDHQEDPDGDGGAGVWGGVIGVCWCGVGGWVVLHFLSVVI